MPRWRLIGSWVANLLVPGTMQVWHGRMALGATLGGLYSLSLSVILVAWLIAPADIPVWLTVVSAGCMGGAFTYSQVTLAQVLARRCDPAWPGHIAALEEIAETQFTQGNHLAALVTIEHLLDEQPDNLRGHLLRARIHAGDNRVFQARRAYRRLAEVDCQGQYADETKEAMRRFGGAR